MGKTQALWLTSSNVPCSAKATASSQEFVAIPLDEDELVAVVPADHQLRDRGVVAVADLASDPFILSIAGCERMITGVFASAGLAPRVAFQVIETATIVNMVREGLGLTMIPALAVPSNLEGVALLRVEPPARRRLALAVHKTYLSSPAVSAFIAQVGLVKLSDEYFTVPMITNLIDNG